MTTRKEKLDALENRFKELIEDESPNKTKLAKVISDIKEEFYSLDDNHQNVIRESVSRKDTIKELNNKLDETSAIDSKSKESMEAYKAEIEDLKVKVSTSEAALKTYDNDLIKDWESKAEKHKIAENDKLKNFYTFGTDDKPLTIEDVRSNRTKYSEHVELGLFEGKNPNNLPPVEKPLDSKTRLKNLENTFASTFKK